MDVSGIATQAGMSTIGGRTPDPKLKEACDQVEGLFLKMLLKEGMASMLENAEGHSSSVLGYALEQTAEQMARDGDMGIANHIYEQLANF